MPRPPATDSENPEWTKADFAKARPASALPDHILSAFPKTRGPQKSATKIAVSIRLDPDVVAKFKATGPGWQGRINDALKAAKV